MKQDATLAILPDVQQSADGRGVALQHAGVRNVVVPLPFEIGNRGISFVPVTCALSVGLEAASRGANMSRFIGFLNSLREAPHAELQVATWLTGLQELLESSSSRLVFRYTHFIDRAAPVTGVTAPMGYEVEVTAVRAEGQVKTAVRVEVPVGNLCPCSKAISEYGAHNQRARITAVAMLEDSSSVSLAWIEQFICDVEQTSSSPVYPYLKRQDEKFVTEQQYDNPKFVEDVARDAALVMAAYAGVRGYAIDVEALESIHAHNAWASVAENFEEL